ncbi:hypothetical protein D9M68_483810 [compost metagenome]
MNGTVVLTVFLTTWAAVAAWGFAKRTGATIALGGGFLAGCLTLVAVVAGSKLLQPEDPNAWKAKDNPTMAYIMMEDFVKARLKAPATAKFPGILDGRDKHVKALGEQRYFIFSYVDAQNSFGASIRTRFEGKIQQTAKGEWQLESLRLIE